MNMVHYIVYYIIFGVRIIPFKSGKKLKIVPKKKILLKAYTKPSLRLQSVPYFRDFLLVKFFMKCFFKNIRFQL